MSMQCFFVKMHSLKKTAKINGNRNGDNYKKLFFAPARLEMLTGFTLPPAGGIRTQGFS